MNDPKPTSRALREGFERDYVLPLARAMFQLEPRCQSVLVTVGQYWCDEATDAVHSHELACEDRDPVWPRAGQVHLGAICKVSEIEELVRDGEAHPGQDDYVTGLAEVQYALWDAARRKAFGDGNLKTLDENSDMIVAFASYCREVSDQEQPSWRSHTPYCVVRREPDDAALRCDLIGRMHRPEWEDRWDVLEQDGIISGIVSREPEELPGTDPFAGLERVRPPSARKVVLLLVLGMVTIMTLAMVYALTRSGGVRPPPEGRAAS